MKEPPDGNFVSKVESMIHPNKKDDYFKSIKVSLKYVLKNEDINQEKINNLVIKAHKIVIHTLQFIRPETGKPF